MTDDAERESRCPHTHAAPTHTDSDTYQTSTACSTASAGGSVAVGSTTVATAVVRGTTLRGSSNVRSPSKCVSSRFFSDFPSASDGFSELTTSVASLTLTSAGACSSADGGTAFPGDPRNVCCARSAGVAREDHRLRGVERLLGEMPSAVKVGV